MRMRSPPFVPVKSNSKFHPLSLSLSLSSSSHSPFELGLGFRIRFFSLSKLPIKSRFDFSTSISMATSLALSKIERAHQMYRVGNHGEALGLYTEALAMAKTRAQKIALHSNRAACYLKLHDFNEAAEECTAVLELDRQHTGALMLRAQTLVTLKEYQSALFDVNRLMELNPSSDVYRNLQSRLKTQLSLAPIPESEEESLYPEEEEKEKENDRLTGNKKSEDPNISPKAPASLAQNLEPLSDVLPKGWEAIPKPKGHSGLDYSRWDNVENDSSEEEDNEEEEHQPQYRFRVRTVGVRPVK